MRRTVAALWPCISCEQDALLASEWNVLIMACPHCLLLERVLVVDSPAVTEEANHDESSSPQVRILAG